MDMQKLLAASGGPGPEFDYPKEVVARLVRVLSDQLTLVQSIALMDILTSYTFLYDDGFIINNKRDLIQIIGFADAAAIVATFWDDPERDWEWFKAEHLVFDRKIPEYAGILNQLLTAILQEPTVRLPEDDDGNTEKRQRK